MEITIIGNNNKEEGNKEERNKCTYFSFQRWGKRSTVLNNVDYMYHLFFTCYLLGVIFFGASCQVSNFELTSFI
ncbi:hypothetical protein CROQUDRAFT_519145 [Cronartium quercuum f. sp. fusiforme G11]|uniref:Uncharacterized protein n=1 Tax=Cronartium quercuum f. sp. fusiforme G11 TaxID=708437 RepID=A0A9P6NM30_9BASI|nr:hypothetical protein CROQUDRAFT_519145 [Cronartium quercuum f. sp. fusiforme G11]